MNDRIRRQLDELLAHPRPWTWPPIPLSREERIALAALRLLVRAGLVRST